MSLICIGMPILLAILKKMSRARYIGKIYKLFMKRSMTIYLYQSFAFLIVTGVWNKVVSMLFLNKNIWFEVFQIIIYYNAIVLISAIMASVLGYIEDWGK